ncbi:MAG: site-specific integrase [Alphaproteobacteria bacterium]|nr:site-specific integrase [Alphaproteobacteria bacterium]
MPIKKITINSVKNMLSGETLWDTEVKGFGCRRSRDVRSFILKYRIGTGRGARQYKFTIGKLGSPWTPDSAREEAKRLLGQIAQGKNPAAGRKREKTASDIGHAFSQFLEESNGKRTDRTRNEYHRMFEKYLKKDIGGYRIGDVNKQDIQRILTRLSASPIQANRLLQMLRAFFNWCEQEKHRDIHTNPCSGINKHKEKTRERYLSEEELQRLGAALLAYEEEQKYIKPMKHQKKPDVPELNTVTPYVTAAIRLLILTGARKNEILTLKWEFVDFERRQLRLPESKTGEKVIHLSAPALQLLSEIPRIVGNPYVICGKNDGEHLVNIKDPWGKIRKTAGLEDVRLHDLRHNFASIGLASGLHLKVIGTLLGHSQIKTTERYAHLANDPLQTANEMIGKRIADTMMQRPGANNVVSLPKS